MYLERVLCAATTDSHNTLSKLSLLDSKERELLLTGWNDTRTDYGPALPS